MQYFDYEKVAREAGLTDDELASVKEVMRAEFPQDDMMWELHILRACAAIRDGHATLQDVTQRLAA
ncbi:MAG: hypothetical protein A2Z18_07070 [Armatimonadetes bacterium RBG_16_58_9]|nr:MAG: hypothetical protein A2Z18_07070 [Armatimonadetes bacterium RBG_16_58_9]